MNPSIACRCCGSARTRLFGRAARARSFAGVPLAAPLDGGHLYRCTQCDLLMRHPLLTADAYVALYAPSAGDHWTKASLRPEQQKIRDHVWRVLPQGGRVLDVGCASGDLLEALGPAYQKFGVEPAAQARARAQALGVQVVCSAVEELGSSALKFDLITAVDVIEHVPDPLAFLRTLTRNLAAGGQIVVSTGNSRARIWLLCGPSYYYSYFFEHLSFISPQWWAHVANQEFEVTIIDPLFSHQEAQPLGKVRYAQKLARLGAKMVLSWLERAVLLRLPTLSRRLGLRLMLGEPGLFKDHVMAAVSLRSPGHVVGATAGPNPLPMEPTK